MQRQKKKKKKKKEKTPPIVIRKVAKPICPYVCPYVNVRYLYQPGEQEGGGKRRATDPILSVDVHKIDYHIITQGIRVYYLKAPAPKRGFVKEELLIVLDDSQTRMSWFHLVLCIAKCLVETVLFCLLLVHICCGAWNAACSFCVHTSVCLTVHLCSSQSLSVS